MRRRPWDAGQCGVRPAWLAAVTAPARGMSVRAACAWRRVVGAVVAAVCLAAGAVAGRDHPSAKWRVEEARAAAAGGVQHLLSYYDWPSGMFTSTGVNAFWTTANALETLANYVAVTGEVGVAGYPPITSYLDNTLSKQVLDIFTDGYRDDHLWYTLAYLRAHAVFGNASYLEVAETIVADLVGPWHALNATCGGMNWDVNIPYVNAITNELFLSAVAGLAHATGNSTTPMGNATYFQWARTQWDWLSSSAMVQPDALFQDGLSMANCSAVAPGAALWTYNQGVVLSGAALLTQLTGDDTIMARAIRTATAAVGYFASSPTNPYGALVEISCGANGVCDGLDGKQFKGVFVRHLWYALPTMAVQAPQAAATLTAALLNQTASILSHDAHPTPGGMGMQYGQLWQGPFLANDTNPYVSQGAALDAVVAGLAIMMAAT